MNYVTVDNKCPKCSCVFQTMDDEFGTHSCPHCGYAPDTTVECAGCGEAIEPSEDVYVLGDGTITHADSDCLKEAVEAQFMTLEEAMQG